MLASRLPADLPGRDIVNPMLARIDALERTVQDIPTYARPTAPKRQRFDARASMADAVASAQAAVKGARIQTSGDTAVLDADPEMCRAVLLNLLLNACQAGGDAPVTVCTRVDDRYLEVVISDRGPGIPAEVRRQLFEPFVTTKLEEPVWGFRSRDA